LTPDNGQQIEFAVGVGRHEGLSRFRGVKWVLRGGNGDVTVRDEGELGKLIHFTSCRSEFVCTQRKCWNENTKCELNFGNELMTSSGWGGGSGRRRNMTRDSTGVRWKLQWEGKL
jgi:hypothetical protein